jgi:hypothetical protein
MFENFKSEIKLFIIVAVISMVFAAGIILLLNNSQVVQAPEPPPAVEPAPSPQSQTVDTSNWQTYRNDEFGFELEYPNSYMKNNDSYNRINQTALVNFRYNDDPNYVSVVAVHHLQDEEIESKRYINLSSTLPEFIDYITDPNQYERVESMSLGEKEIQVFFFESENPGWFGDSTDTLIAMVEKDSNVFFVRKHGAELDAEFKQILASVQFNQGYTPNFPDLSGWETYRNEELGFEMDHPILTPVFANRDQTRISVKNSDIFGISVVTGVTYEQGVERLRRFWGEIVDEGREVSFAGVRAFELDTGVTEGSSKVVVFAHPEKDVTFTIQIAKSFFEEGFPDQILSTFRFVGATDTSTWQTYRNDEFGFEVKYPLQWEQSFPSNAIVSFKHGDENINYDFWIRTEENKTNLTLQEYFRVEKQESLAVSGPELYFPFEDVEPIANIEVGGQKAYQFELSGVVRVFSTIFSNKGNIFNLNSNRVFDDAKVRETYNQILSTFRFVDDGSKANSGQGKYCQRDSDCGEVYCESELICCTPTCTNNTCTEVCY